jgi:hypothetical protein
VDTTKGFFNHPTHVHNLPAKFKDQLTSRGMQTLKVKRHIVIADGKDKVQLPPTKPNKSLLEKPDAETSQVSLDEGPKQLNTHVFSQASEDAQDTCKNTEESHLDDWEGRSSRQTSLISAGECPSDEDKWGFSELNQIANEDAQVRIHAALK